MSDLTIDLEVRAVLRTPTEGSEGTTEELVLQRSGRSAFFFDPKWWQIPAFCVANLQGMLAESRLWGLWMLHQTGLQVSRCDINIYRCDNPEDIAMSKFPPLQRRLIASAGQLEQ